jgi:hypothetical protein
MSLRASGRSSSLALQLTGAHRLIRASRVAPGLEGRGTVRLRSLARWMGQQARERVLAMAPKTAGGWRLVARWPICTELVDKPLDTECPDRSLIFTGEDHLGELTGGAIPGLAAPDVTLPS